ncbi:Tat proofreading chaperone DmsD [Mangrovibacter yixingensis]|uniref:Tat proofreading chaperone DmsD n=1 Tax=Mangrovibacter yixingensis TaxID=1529639 RepID=UPI001CFAD99A|nr:Tat proofreading chaperone DmsD [Mangrovibacter yixingensis]
MSRLENIALTGRALGALFYFPPQAQQSRQLVDAFLSGGWLQDWPWMDDKLKNIAVKMQSSAAQGMQLNETWQRLFIGPDTLPSPPWGSVWLDKENVLFGDSLLALRSWMQHLGIQYETNQNEPEDHIGTLLMLAAWLAENGQEQATNELLAWHILPWAPRFLNVLAESEPGDFYSALCQLTQITLQHWQAESPVPVADKPLWR